MDGVSDILRRVLYSVIMDLTETCATDTLHALSRPHEPASQPTSLLRQDALCDRVDAAGAYGVSAARKDIRAGLDDNAIGSAHVQVGRRATGLVNIVAAVDGLQVEPPAKCYAYHWPSSVSSTHAWRSARMAETTREALREFRDMIDLPCTPQMQHSHFTPSVRSVDRLLMWTFTPT